jgi:hypothetical protein
LFWCSVILGGVGVRERSRYAAAAVLILFALDTLIAGIGIVRVLISGLLVSNLRATWIASQWKPGAEEAIMPPRLSETWSDKFADTFPAWLWPKVRILYFVYSACLVVLIAAGFVAIMLRRAT